MSTAPSARSASRAPGDNIASNTSGSSLRRPEVPGRKRQLAHVALAPRAHRVHDFREQQADPVPVRPNGPDRVDAAPVANPMPGMTGLRLSLSELQVLNRRCPGVLAEPFSYDADLVELCRNAEVSSSGSCS